MLPVWINQSTNGLAGQAQRQPRSRCALGLIEKWVNTVRACVCACTCISLCITPFESVIMYVQPCVCVCIPVCSQLIHPSACMTSPSKLFISVQALPAWIICLPYKYLNAHRSLICTDTVRLQSTTPRTNIHTKLLPLPQWNITNVVDGVSCLQLDVVQTIIHKTTLSKQLYMTWSSWNKDELITALQ